MAGPSVTVVVVFYNMRREATRTLHTLSTRYQQGVTDDDYEVIAVDNGSSHPLEEEMVTSYGANFSYRFHETQSKSPCSALNQAAQAASGEHIVCLIDGARMLSPGIIRLVKTSSRLCAHPFIYTLAMHLGPEVQNLSLQVGYNQVVEDELLRNTDWQQDGYRLFNIASVALSSKKGFFSAITESNCFALRRNDFMDLGGFDERFESPGGGLANLDLFNRANSRMDFQPIMLLGEASFHQFHGGVCTNVALQDHPMRAFKQEYRAIRGKDYSPLERAPLCFGPFRPVCADLYRPDGGEDGQRRLAADAE